MTTVTWLVLQKSKAMLSRRLVFVLFLLGGVRSGEAQRPAANYWVYVAAESADLLHRIRFGPDGAVLEHTAVVGELFAETEGPHGIRVSPDGKALFLTTGHGIPDGKLWKIEAGPDTVVGTPIYLGRFPSTLDVTPDGLYAFVANFNLHGELEPSTVSVVYTPDLVEVTQTVTCTQPHGMRIHPNGLHAYSGCVVDDLVVELDTRTFQVTRRLDVAVALGAASMSNSQTLPACAPTWTAPVSAGDRIYVACNRGDRILELAYEDLSVRRTITTGRGPYNLAVTPDGKTLIATLKQGNAVQFFDLLTGESLGIVSSSGTVTHGVVVSPDNRYAFVSVENVGAQPGKVDIYEIASRKPVASVDVGQQAGGIAFWKMVPVR